MNIRALAAADAMHIAELWHAGALESAAADQAFRPRVTLAEYGASLQIELNTGAVFGWGAFSAEGTLHGYLTAKVVPPSPDFEQAESLYLLDLDVRPHMRRQGIATALVRSAQRYAHMNGITSLEVGWLATDARSTAFWRKQGCVPYFTRARLSPSVVQSAGDA
ncbi:MAG: GNAT family N-acetyltransferase [Burkholderiaceae bacterium]|nr:GNAT family N-acetyltransferase [Burkholderiaceae bacterium]